VVIKSQNSKAATYIMAWETIGVPLNQEGPVPNPSAMSAPGSRSLAGGYVQRSLRERIKAANNLWGGWTGAPMPRKVQSGPSSHQFSHLHPGHAVAGSIDPFGSLFPVFNPPPGFQLRLGAGASDEFLSGTFPVGKSTIGFIRIPSFEPGSETNALQQFQGEMAYFQQNTSGLVIDEMSNGGGDGCYANTLLQYLFPVSFQSIGIEVKPTEEWVLNFENELIDAELGGAPQATINRLTSYLNQVQQALAQGRGLTGPLPFCTDTLSYPPATDGNGNNLAFSKPILVLTDNFTASAAEFFGATLQDGNRATFYGVRTSGGGGNVVEFDFNVTPYSEGSSRVTQSMGLRNHNITTPGFPSAPFIENIGVYPDILADYQTRDNLLNGGQTFVNGFSAAISRLVSGHP
jgi:hypothetical protein